VKQYFSKCREKKVTILYPEKISLKNEDKTRTFHKELTTDTSEKQEVLEEILQAKEKQQLYT
jgi:hypothetical protein